MYVCTRLLDPSRVLPRQNAIDFIFRMLPWVIVKPVAQAKSVMGGRAEIGAARPEIETCILGALPCSCIGTDIVEQSAGSHFGAVASDTLLGPPDRMMPAGLRARISAIGVSGGHTSEYTDSSRRRRAINWVNCEPKSRTMMV